MSRFSWYKSTDGNGFYPVAARKANKKKPKPRRSYRENTNITSDQNFYRVYVYIPMPLFEKFKAHCLKYKYSYSEFVTLTFERVFDNIDKELAKKASGAGTKIKAGGRND